MGSDGKEGSRSRGKSGGVRQIITIITVALAVVAIIKELRTPKDQRTWNGKVAGVVPYDFRMPTVERFKERVWNPDGEHYVGPRVFGVGWTVNAGKVVATARERLASRATSEA